MKQIKGNIWDYYGHDCYVGVTTNGFVKKNGQGVMGAGIAKQASQRFPDLPDLLGSHIKAFGNNVTFVSHLHLMFFPVKHHWKEKADLDLIERSCKQLKEAFDHSKALKVYLSRPGCGNGQLTYEQVEPILLKYFDKEDRLTIIDLCQ